MLHSQVPAPYFNKKQNTALHFTSFTSLDFGLGSPSLLHRRTAHFRIQPATKFVEASITRMKGSKDLILMPDSVLLYLFSEWFEVRALVRLDSACCGVQMRSRLTELWRRLVMQKYHGPAPFCRRKEYSTEWLFCRRVKVKNIRIWGSNPANLALIQLSGASVTELS
jgi:hypothetical protein